jgi:hypothetical protein
MDLYSIAQVKECCHAPLASFNARFAEREDPSIVVDEEAPLLRAEDHRMDVAAWLRGLGLEQYASAFRDNDVDGEVLPELTADDLISIGVTSVGHRRKLLAAIAALGEPPAVVQSAASATPAPTSPPTIDAERRQLTVMFCDLVGSARSGTASPNAGAGRGGDRRRFAGLHQEAPHQAGLGSA